MSNSNRSSIIPKHQHLLFDLGNAADCFLSHEKISISVSDHFVHKIIARNIPIDDVVTKFERFLDLHYEDILVRMQYSRIGIDIRIISKSQVIVLEAKFVSDDHIRLSFITTFDDAGGLRVLLTGNEYYV